jgi:uncharacterized protein
MIKTVLKKRDNHISEILVEGHANYDHKGKDIVCAAVSTALIISVNLIEKFKLDHKIDLKVNDGYFKLQTKDVDLTIDTILSNLEYSLDDLEKQYPIYIKIKKEG